MPMRARLAIAAAGVALVLAGCGNDPEGAPRPAPDKTTQQQDAGKRPIRAHYVDKRGGEWPHGVDVVTAGEKIRGGVAYPGGRPTHALLLGVRRRSNAGAHQRRRYSQHSL